jgi:hypothetical protein
LGSCRVPPARVRFRRGPAFPGWIGVRAGGGFAGGL